MDMGTKLEHALRHLKHAEPEIEHWMEFGDLGRSTEVYGVLLNSGALNKDMRHMVNRRAPFGQGRAKPAGSEPLPQRMCNPLCVPKYGTKL